MYIIYLLSPCVFVEECISQCVGLCVCVCVCLIAKLLCLNSSKIIHVGANFFRCFG